MRSDSDGGETDPARRPTRPTPPPAQVIWKVRERDATWTEGFSYAPKDELFPAQPGKAGNGAARDWPGVDDLIDHDKLTALAMKLLKSGMSDGKAVNHLRGLVSSLTNVPEDTVRG
jgi:hypothetical protein